MSDIIVSVIMPAYKMEQYIERAISSVLVQTLEAWELIIVDDASPDGTWSLIEEAARRDSRIRPIRLPANGKAPHASNVAIAAARGRWVAVLDADDWIAPSRLARLVELGETGDYDVVADNQFLFDQQARRCVGTVLPWLDEAHELGLADYISHSITGLSRFDHGMLKPLVRTSFLHHTQVRYRVGCHDGYDFHFLLDCLVYGARLVVTQVPFYFYMQPFGSASKRVSHTGRTHYKYNLMKQHVEEALLEYHDRLSAKERALLQRRSRSITAFADYLEAKVWLAERRIAAAGLALVRRPSITLFAACAVLRRLRLRPREYRLERVTGAEA